MPAPRQIIAVDMDEVIADALAEALLRYNRDTPPDDPANPTISHADLHGRYLWDVAPRHRFADIERYMLSDDFFRVLPIMPHAQRVLARLQSRYDIYIASAAMEVPSSFTPKYHWLREHFPFIPPVNIVFCGNKSIIRADFLIDDNPRQLRLFEDATTTPAREGILFTAPANAHITDFRRVNNWLDVEAMFLNESR